MSPKPRYQRVELPAEFVDLALRRTAFLFELTRQQNLAFLFASAYLQGASDVAETMRHKENLDG